MTTTDDPNPEQQYDVPLVRAYDTKFTPAAQDRIIRAIMNHNSLPAAAALAGVTAKTLYRWIALGVAEENDPDSGYAAFRMRVEQADAISESSNVQVVATSALKGNVEDAKWLLERRHGSKGWRKTDEQKVMGDPDAPIRIQISWPGAPQDVDPIALPTAPVDNGGDDDIVDAEVIEPEGGESSSPSV